MIIPPVLQQKNDPQIKKNVNVGRRKPGKKVSYELTVQIEALKRREEGKTGGWSFNYNAVSLRRITRSPADNIQPLSSNDKLFFTPHPPPF